MIDYMTIRPQHIGRHRDTGRHHLDPGGPNGNRYTVRSIISRLIGEALR